MDCYCPYFFRIRTAFWPPSLATGIDGEKDGRTVWDSKHGRKRNEIGRTNEEETGTNDLSGEREREKKK